VGKDKDKNREDETPEERKARKARKKAKKKARAAEEASVDEAVAEAEAAAEESPGAGDEDATEGEADGGDPYGDGADDGIPEVAAHEDMDDATFIKHMLGRHPSLCAGQTKLKGGAPLRGYRGAHMRQHNSGAFRGDDDRHAHAAREPEVEE
jgi:hypothetical protein